jgi:hypothetical protein
MGPVARSRVDRGRCRRLAVEGDLSELVTTATERSAAGWYHLRNRRPDPLLRICSGWYLGFVIAVVVIAVVVALVAPVLVLAARIPCQAPQINQALQQSYRNTLPLADLRQTIDHAEVIIGDLECERARLGG